MSIDVVTIDLNVQPLPSDLGPRALAAGHDDAGAPVRVRHDLDGAQLRCCLRDSRAGEAVVLVAVVPPGPRGPYAERGPVFVHGTDCGGPERGGFPEQWRARPQVFRAYDGDGAIVGGELVGAGRGQEEAVERLFADPAVAFFQTRNIVYGCYLATIVRPGARIG